jgi:hypothetical protein
MLLVISDYIALMVGLMNEELGRIWKAAFIAYYSRYCQVQTEENHKILRIADALAITPNWAPPK